MDKAIQDRAMQNNYSEGIIVWIDGTYGVGKSAAVNAFQQNYQLCNRNYLILDSDFYYLEGIKKYVWGGCYPQNNQYFINDFKKTIEKNASKTDTVILVVMALTMDECRNHLLGYFTESGYHNIHIILDADLETIILRVNNSSISRDKSLAINSIQINTKYLKDNYPDAEWIDTNDKSVNEVAENIAHIINQYVRIARSKNAPFS